MEGRIADLELEYSEAIEGRAALDLEELEEEEEEEEEEGAEGDEPTAEAPEARAGGGAEPAR